MIPNHAADFDNSMMTNAKPDFAARSSITSKQHNLFASTQSQKALLNFESKLQNDLNSTTSSLIEHLKSHSILSDENLPLMKPIENCLKDCFTKMQILKIPENKNYFAMSLKMFFMSLTEDELEFVCHNYVHNWINLELKRKNRLLSKY
jgi:hypothetical protein